MATIQGIDQLTDFLTEHPKELNKSAIQSLMKGSNVLKKEIINQMPGSIKSLKPIVASKALTNSENPNILVGIFGKRMFYVNRRGKKWDAFYLAYWQNYGTLANRDPGHLFIKGRRRTSQSWRGGIRPNRFFDRAVDSSFEAALNVSEQDLNKIIDDLSAKYGFQ